MKDKEGNVLTFGSQRAQCRANHDDCCSCDEQRKFGLVGCVHFKRGA